MSWASRPFRPPPHVPPPRVPSQGGRSSACSFGANASFPPEWGIQQRQHKPPPLQSDNQRRTWTKRSRQDSLSDDGECGRHPSACDLPTPKRGQLQSGPRPSRHYGGQRSFPEPQGAGPSVRGRAGDAGPSRYPSWSGNIHRARQTHIRESAGHVPSDFAETRQGDGSACCQIQCEVPGRQRNSPSLLRPPVGSRNEPPPQCLDGARQRRVEATMRFSGRNPQQPESRANNLGDPPSCKGMDGRSRSRSESSVKEPQGQHFQRSKDKVLTPLQISKRDADILHTKRSEGYQRYVRAVPREKRSPSCRSTWHPVTPCSSQNLSVKQWRDLLSKWRHQVHLWTNLPESVYSRISGMSVEDQVKALGSMTARELDSRDEIHKDPGKGEGNSTVEVREATGRSSEEIACWLTALELPAGTRAGTPALADNSDALFRPILFVPSWYRTVLHRKK
ncbi:conserved hypothetical protein [Neospora caninum Liverpool]|nr:conserved hypothetical protein [Neospora caninum Liverpool]CBZ55957.1 conserved hypothetical protein [Neospora caninum Liverpool]|eukprot:XP_003885983.1 conserved hypothetical protein [Neospora caninum Liverpool]